MTHFRVPAREMLLDEPLCCPLYGALTFDGLAIDREERVHLVVRTAAARAHLGPRQADVTRRAGAVRFRTPVDHPVHWIAKPSCARRGGQPR